jgi:hypothetical protein
MMNNDFQNVERAVHFQPGFISRKRKKRFVALLTVFVLIAATL